MPRKVLIDEINYEIDLESKFHYFTNIYIEDPLVGSLMIGSVEWNFSSFEIFLIINNNVFLEYLFDNKIKYDLMMNELFSNITFILNKDNAKLEKIDQSHEHSFYSYKEFNKKDIKSSFDVDNRDYVKNSRLLTDFFSNKNAIVYSERDCE